VETLLLNTARGYWERQTIEVCQVDFIAVDTVVTDRQITFVGITIKKEYDCLPSYLFAPGDEP
jgi:hypothetical protein